MAASYIKGGGYSYIFNSPYAGEYEIRTPYLPDGLGSFTVSIWLRNMIPSPTSDDSGNVGYQGGLLSYYDTTNNPPSSAGGTFGNSPQGLTNYHYPNNKFFSLADYLEGAYITTNYTEKFKVLNDANGYPLVPFCLSLTDDSTWYQNILSWDADTLTFNLSAYAMDSDGLELHNNYNITMNNTNANYVSKWPPGYFRIGMTSGFDPNTNIEMDDFCLLTRKLNDTEMKTLTTKGCHYVATANDFHYSFDYDNPSNVPDIFNDATSSYSGVSTYAVSLMPVTVIPIGTGPFRSLSSAPLYNGFITTFHNLSASFNQTIQFNCYGNCSSATVIELPPFVSLKSNNNSISLNGIFAPLYNISSISSLVGAPDNLSGFCFSFTFSFTNISLVGYSNFQIILKINDSIKSTNLTIESKLYQPPSLKNDILSGTEGDLYTLFLPRSMSQVINYNGNYDTMEAFISSLSSIAFNRSVGFYDCPACFDSPLINDTASWRNLVESIGINILYQSFPYLVTDIYRRIIVISNLEPTKVNSFVINMNYFMFDGFGQSNIATLSISIATINKVPIASNTAITVNEDTSPLLMQLSKLTYDREGDIIYYEIDYNDGVVPDNLLLFQALESKNGTVVPGVLISNTPSSLSFDQWVSSTLQPFASSVWSPSYFFSAVVGPPDLWPVAADTSAEWEPGLSDYMDCWLMVYFDTPVYPSSLTVYMTWGPGSISSISGRPYSQNGTDYSLDGFQLLYNEPITTDLYCTHQASGSPCAARIRYELWSTTFPVNCLLIRFHLTDSARFIGVDAMSLSGSVTTKGNAVIDKLGRFFVQPKPHTYGPSAIQFQVSDLSYFSAWGTLKGLDTRRGIISVDVVELNEEPVSNGGGTITVDPINPTWLSELSGYDVNNGNVLLQILSLPIVNVGTLYLMNNFTNARSDITTQTHIILIDGTTGEDKLIIFNPAYCLTPSPMSTTITFQLTCYDKRGTLQKSIQSQIVVDVPCSLDNLHYSLGTLSLGPFAAVLGFSMFGIIFSIITFVVVYKYRRSMLISSIKLKFCMPLIIACFFGNLSAIFFVMYPTSVSCGLRDISLGISFALTMGTLQGTAVRIFALFGDPNSLRKITYSDSKVVKNIVGVLLAELAVLIIGIATKCYAYVISTSNYQTLLIVDQCSYYNIYLVTQGFFFVAGDVYTIYLAWKVFHAPSGFNESRHLFNAAIIQLTIVFIVVPAGVFLGSTDASTFLMGAGISFGSTLTLCSMFIPKFLIIYHGGHDAADQLMARTGTDLVEKARVASVGSNNSSGSKNKEDKINSIKAMSATQKIHPINSPELQPISKSDEKTSPSFVLCKICQLTTKQILDDFEKKHRESDDHKRKVQDKMKLRQETRNESSKIKDFKIDEEDKINNPASKIEENMSASGTRIDSNLSSKIR